MACVLNLVRSAAREIAFWARNDVTVTLRHRSSGAVLTVGGIPAEPVRFGSRAAAEGFAGRYLDEPAGWEPVPVAGLASDTDLDQLAGSRAA